MALKLHQGDRILIELKNSEIYEGNVEHVCSSSIELYDIFCSKTSTSFTGNMTFYKNEVLHVSKVSPDTEKPQEVAPEKQTFLTTKKITMDPDEFHRLKQMTFDFIFIDRHERLNSAVEVLSSRESVAVVGLGDTETRGKGLGLLLMADFKQVYIFDLIFLVQLRGLRDILESTFITKVVHDGAPLYDCLQNQYKVEMKNVFDTKIVDTTISAQKGEQNISRNISEILTHYFNFPPSLLSAAVDEMIDKTWIQRPIDRNDRIKAAQLVTYLLPLRDRLMAQILKPYHDAIQKEYVHFKNTRDLNQVKFK